MTETTVSEHDGPAARIAIFEDSIGHLDGLVAYLERWSNFEVVATANSPAEAMTIVEDVDGVAFDAAIVDLELVPGTDIPHGFDIANQIRKDRPDALIYLWSHYAAEGDLIRRASRIFRGRFLVDGVLSKHKSNADLVEAITQKLEKPSVGFWLDIDLKPPANCYSAVDDLTGAEARNLGVLARRAGASRQELVEEAHIVSGTWTKQIAGIKAKVAREVTERMRASAPVEFEVSREKDVTNELLTRWARARNLHWRVSEFEKPETQ